MNEFTLLWSYFTKFYGFKALDVILLEETSQIKARETLLPFIEPLSHA